MRLKGNQTTTPPRGAQSLMVMNAALASLLVMLATSCMPVDEPVSPFDRGGVEEQRVNMGSNYATALYYDLTTRSVVLTRPITSWHLSISGSPTDSLIYINTALVMSATNLGSVTWESVTSPNTAPELLRYDAPSGDPDSTAFGIWWNGDGSSKGDVYLVNLGIDEDAAELGWRKVMPIRVDVNGITVRIAKLDGTSDSTIVIPRDVQYEHVGISCAERPVVVYYEPLAKTWDLLFTRYTYFFYAPDFLAYAVTGVLQSRHTQISRTDSVAFASVQAADTTRFPFTDALDVIGYDWKSYDIPKGVYTTDTSQVFLVRDHSGFINKLRFLDFYSEGGSKGSPLFVVQRL